MWAGLATAGTNMGAETVKEIGRLMLVKRKLERDIKKLEQTKEIIQLQRQLTRAERMKIVAGANVVAKLKRKQRRLERDILGAERRLHYLQEAIARQQKEPLDEKMAHKRRLEQECLKLEKRIAWLNTVHAQVQSRV